MGRKLIFLGVSGVLENIVPRLLQKAIFEKLHLTGFPRKFPESQVGDREDIFGDMPHSSADGKKFQVTIPDRLYGTPEPY